MPTIGDGIVDLPHKENEMANDITEAGNLTVALTAMADEFGASAARRSSSADQLASDSQRMWSIAMTTPTVLAAKGIQMATEAGSGRTRAETNLPAATSAAGNAK